MTKAPRVLACLAAVVLIAGCRAEKKQPALSGDWDAYFANGSRPHDGFEGWRRMGYAHFSAPEPWSIRQRTGEPILEVERVVTGGDSVHLVGARGQELSARWRGDTLVGVLLNNGQPSGRRIRLVPGSGVRSPEKPYAVWPGA